MVFLEKFDQHLITYLQNSSVSTTLLILTYTLVVFIFCLIIAYKTGISDLPKKHYTKAYNYNKEAKKLINKNQEIKESIEKLNKEARTHLRNLYKNKTRLEKQAYSLLSKELTKEDYNSEIDTLADKASNTVFEANDALEKIEDDIVKDIYGFEG